MSWILNKQQARDKYESYMPQPAEPFEYYGSFIKIPHICPICKQIFNTATPNGVWTHNTKSCGCLNKHSINRIKDLTKTIVGKLTFIKYYYTNNNNKAVWLCKCKCGDIRKYIANSIISKNTQSCGHCNDPKIGQVFRYLTVTKIIPCKSRGCTVECLCKCGNIWKGHSNQLLNKITTSCGCYKQELCDFNIKRIDLTGKIFDYWTVISYFGLKQGNKIKYALWNCRCRCGTIKQIRGSNLTNHTSCSCGCNKQSKGEIKIRDTLIKYHIDYIQQKRFDNCRNKIPLPFDFYLPKYNMCVEYQGEHHYYQNRRSTKEKDSLLNVQYRDNIKKQYCINNNIKLLDISYVEFNNIEDILCQTLNLTKQ